MEPIVNRILVILTAGIALGAAAVPQLVCTDRLLAEFPVGGDTLRVIATVVHESPGDGWPDSSLAVIRIMNGRGGVPFSDSMPPARDESGRLLEEIDVAATPFAFESGEGLRLWRTDLPSAPSYGGDCRYFALRGRRLVPVTPWCGVCGDLLPGDRVLAREWMSWFRVLVPVRIYFEREKGGMEAVPERDEGSGLAVLDIEGVGSLERWYEEADTALLIRLYRGPVGDAGDSVTVTPASTVRFGRVYAGGVWIGADGSSGVEVVIRRLEVTIDGRRGYVETRDFPALGLRQAG
jgi:hypothetical protein